MRGTLPASEVTDGNVFKPRVLSRESRLFDIDLQKDSLDSIPKTFAASLAIERPGTLGAVVRYFRAHLDEETQLATGPFSPATHWGWDVRPLSRAVAVKAGDEVAFRAELGHQLGRQHLFLDLA